MPDLVPSKGEGGKTLYTNSWICLIFCLNASRSTNYKKRNSDSFVSRKIILYGKNSDKIVVDFGGRGSFWIFGPV